MNLGNRPVEAKYPMTWLREVDAERDWPELLPLQMALEEVWTRLDRPPELRRRLEEAEKWFVFDYPVPFERGIVEESHSLKEKIESAKWRVASVILGKWPGETLRGRPSSPPQEVPGAVDKLLDAVLEDAEAAGIPMSAFPNLPPDELSASLERRRSAGASRREGSTGN